MSLPAVAETHELTMRDQVHAMEAAIRAHPTAFTELPTYHHFAPGVYAREMHIPAGAVIVGKIHKYGQLNILSAGDISVLTEDGIKRVQAPFTVSSPPGTKRVAFAHTDCVWTTILATDETDIEVIESKFTAESEQECLAFIGQSAGEQKCLS